MTGDSDGLSGLDGMIGSAEALRDVFDDLEDRSRSFGNAMTAALKGAVLEGDSLTEVLQNVANRFASIALSSGLAPLETALGGAISGLTNAVSGAVAPTASATLALATVSSGAGTPAAQPTPVNVTFHVQATDAASFRKSEGQINAMLTRAVARGRRGN